MAALTEDQKRAFGTRITEMYNDPSTAADLAAKSSGLDPTVRGAQLTTQKGEADSAELDQTKKKAAAKKSTEVSVAKTETFYTNASEGASSLATELGEDHPYSQEIHKIRPDMANEAARGPHTPKIPKTP